MREILAAIERWHGAGEQIALATVVRVYGSAPQAAGARLAVSGSGALVGSVSGGCVEGAVADACLQALASGQFAVLDFGISNELAWEVGLACGGTIAVSIEPLDAAALNFWLERVPALLAQARPWSMALALDGPQAGMRWTLPGPPPELPPALMIQVEAASRRLLEAEQSQIEHCELDGQPWAIFVESQPLPPHLIIVGGVHIATTLCLFAKQLGFLVSIVDPRGAFATSERFPQADALIREWPDDALIRLRLDRSTYVAVLTHDPKLDDPAILTALRHPVRYIGVLGSRATQQQRRDRLRELGVGDEDLARLHGPIGLPLGGRTPAEIALSILAEMTTVRHGRTLA